MEYAATRGRWPRWGLASTSRRVSANGGMNTNRTSVSVNGSAAATFCYDQADRLTGVTSSVAPFDEYASNPITYDSHGNTTASAGQVLDYDQSESHLVV